MKIEFKNQIVLLKELRIKVEKKRGSKCEEWKVEKFSLQTKVSEHPIEASIKFVKGNKMNEHLVEYLT